MAPTMSGHACRVGSAAGGGQYLVGLSPPGYGYPTVYVAYTAAMVRIQQILLVGSDAPGFPYVPISASQVRC